MLMMNSCNPGLKSEVKKKLGEKYLEEFIVHHDTYNYVLKTYQFQASPKRNKKLVFVGNHNEDLSKFTDNYPAHYLSEEFAKLVKEKVEEYSSPAYVFGSYYFYDIARDSSMRIDDLDIKQILDTATHMTFNIYCYLFEDLTDGNKGEILKGIYNFLERFKNHPKADIALYLNIWKPEFLDRHSLDVFEFDRRNASAPSIELDQRKYVTSRLKLYLETNRPYIDFNIDTLYKYLQAVTPESFGVPPTNLNQLYELQHKPSSEQ